MNCILCNKIFKPSLKIQSVCNSCYQNTINAFINCRANYLGRIDNNRFYYNEWKKVKSSAINITQLLTFCPYCDSDKLITVKLPEEARKKFYRLTSEGYDLLPLETLDFYNDILICENCTIEISDISELFMRNVEITWVPEIDAYRFQFPYKKEVIDLIKVKIPSGHRTIEYEHQQFKGWLISKEYAEILIPILQQIYKGCKFTVITKEQVDQYNQGAAVHVIDVNKHITIFVNLLREARVVNGEFDIHKTTKMEAVRLYKRAAVYFHPDLHPDNLSFAQKSSDLGGAWLELKDSLFKEQ